MVSRLRPSDAAKRERRAELAWLLAALALHGALLWLSARVQGQAPTPPRIPTKNEALSEWSVELESTEPRNASASDAPPAPTPRTHEEQRPRQAARPRAPALPPTAASGDAAERVIGDSAGESGESAREPSRANLSLAELGIGQNPFLGPAGEQSRSSERPAPSAREVGAARFKRAIAGDLARADQAAGLGPEGPVLTALEEAALVGNPDANSTALFRCKTDSTGRLIAIDLVQSSSAPKPWQAIAEAVRKALGNKKLRIPKTGYGLSFEIRVTSRIQMPSGADPGLAVNVLGIPVKEGSGPRSARVDILDIVPRVEIQNVPLPDGRIVEAPVLHAPSILGVHFDPADIGAKARRMIRAHVERVQTNDAP